MFVTGSEWHEREVLRSAREEVFTLGKRGKETSRADLATSRSCHSDPGTNIQTTSFGPSLDDLSNCFPVEKPRYVSYSTVRPVVEERLRQGFLPRENIQNL